MYRTKSINKDEWEKFTSSRVEVNFLHSWQWGLVHKNLGQKVYNIGIFDDEKIVGAVLAIVENAKRGRYIEVPGGPIIDWTDPQATKCAVSALRETAIAEKCVFVRVRPQLVKTKDHVEIFRSLGFRPAPMHLHAEHTSMLDITKPEDELLTAMRKQTRYEIRHALKDGVKISVDTSPQAVSDFYLLQQETAARQHFIPPKKTFLEAEVEVFAPENIAIYRAEKDNELLAMALVVFYSKEAVYHQGASTLAGRNTPGAYAVQWQAIRDAKARGYERYNMFGIAPSGSSKKHRYSGVTTFKRGFGGNDLVYVPAHDLVINRLAYLKNTFVEVVRKRARRV